MELTKAEPQWPMKPPWGGGNMLHQALSNEGSAVLLDLRDLVFIDSTGLNTLAKAHKLSSANGTRFTIRHGLSPAVERAIRCGEGAPIRRLTPNLRAPVAL
jgi:anti-anti-sigma factor